MKNIRMKPGWEKQLEKAVAPAFDQVNRDVNSVLADSDGKSVDQVVSEMAAAFERARMAPPSQGELQKLVETHRQRTSESE